MKWIDLAVAEAIGALILLACLASPQPARAQLLQHDHATTPAWLLAHPDFANCCSNRDCGMLLTPPQPTGAGWVVRVDGRAFPPVPYAQTRRSEDGRFWACILPGAGEIRCLFAPPSGV